MKKITLITLLLFALTANAQEKQKPTIAVISMDAKNLDISPETAASMARMELEKLDIFEVIDRYDVSDMMAKSEIDHLNCYGKNCLVSAGKLLGADKMFSGTIERFSDKKLVITLRLIDVHKNQLERSEIMEFLYLPNELQGMIALTLREMLEIPKDTILSKQLSHPYTYESAVSNPGISKIRSDGPRMGLTAIIGEEGEILMAERQHGGFDIFPVMTQFGYQFETQYLNEGSFQALLEFIPLITGIDQGRFIPSITLLNGFRNNKNGFEFAFGPTINLARKAKGYYDAEGNWHLREEWNQWDSLGNPEPLPYPVEERLDSRGVLKFNTGFVFAFGKTFKSGRLNIPLNAYVVPDFKTGTWRLGVSFGFNAHNRRKEFNP